VILSGFRKRLADEMIASDSPEIQSECEAYLGSIRKMSLARTDTQIPALRKDNWMYCSSDILPLIALQINSCDDLLVHFEQELPDGHDQVKYSKHTHRLHHYLKSFHCKSYAVNEYQYSWRAPQKFYEKMSMPDVTVNAKSKSANRISFNPFTWLEGANFDKVLVEAPCNMDRISMNNPDCESNIYQYQCKPYRMELPKLLEKMLVCAVLNASPYNGEVVYTTRTLNPLHNEFMTQFAIETLREKHGITVVPESLDIFERALADSFDFESSMTLGSLVVPTVFKNSGPRYIVKLRRVVETEEELTFVNPPDLST